VHVPLAEGVVLAERKNVGRPRSLRRREGYRRGGEKMSKGGNRISEGCSFGREKARRTPKKPDEERRIPEGG